MTEIDLIRMNHLIDPALRIWGWEIPVYLFLGGMTAGIMILSALVLGNEKRSSSARLLPIAAPILISLGMGALFLDIEHKLYVWRFYLAFKIGSPMSWGAWILLAIYPATVLLVVAGLTDQQLKTARSWLGGRFGSIGQTASRWLKAVSDFSREHIPFIKKLNLVLGIALGVYTGVLLGTLGARAAWSSMMLAPLFLVSGLSAGAAFMMLFPVDSEEHHFLRKWDMLAIVLELILIALYFVNLGSAGGAEGARALGLFFGGPFTAVFWSLVVILGLVIPLGLEMLESGQAQMIAPVLVLVGGFALRMVLVKAGQA